MSLIVAVQMDPIERVNIDGDSTFVLGLEAQARGHKLHYYQPSRLTLRDGRVTARAHPVELRRERGNHFTLGAAEVFDLAKADVVLMRQDPPFDMAYITATHILEHVHPATLVVNDPVEVRNAPEKLFVAKFEGLMPPTLITSDKDEILAFRAEHKDIIVKPLYGNGGAGVFHITPGDLPEVRQGDKRIILIDGEPAGAINRIPQAGEARSNMHAGGKPVRSALTAREHQICAAIGPELKRRGLIFVGIDVIGDYLTEINVTSPTGLQEINRFDGVKLEAKIWDAIEARLGRR